MQIRTLAELGQIDQRCQRFTPLGLGITRLLNPEAAAEYHQRTIEVDLADNLPESTRKSFERLQRLHVMGILDYELFTAAEGYSLLVLEQAFAERFVAYYEGQVPLVDISGKVDHLKNVQNFDQVYDALNKTKTHPWRKWNLVSREKPGQQIEFNGGFRSLFDWARHEGLLNGQRFRRIEGTIVDVRNSAVHPTSYRLISPIESATSIRRVAEIINRIWGMRSPGGQIFPAPAPREIILPCWNPDDGTLSSNRADDLAIWEERKNWQFIAVLGFDHDDSLWYFDCDFEATNLPAEYLWGPGNREEALAWLATAQVTPDMVDYLDRHFVVHIQGDHVELPRNLNQFAGLPEEDRDGRWLLLKADFPADALGHGRVIASGAKGHTDSGFCDACAVEVEADGSWSSVLHFAEQLGEITPQPPRGIRVEQNRFRWL